MTALPTSRSRCQACPMVIVIDSAAGFTANLGDANLDIATAATFTAAAVLGSVAPKTAARRH